MKSELPLLHVKHYGPLSALSPFPLMKKAIKNRRRLPLLSSSSLSVHPRQKPHHDLRVKLKHNWFGAGLQIKCQWCCMRCSGHWVTCRRGPARASGARAISPVLSGWLSGLRAQKDHRLRLDLLRACSPHVACRLLTYIGSAAEKRTNKWNRKKESSKTVRWIRTPAVKFED